MHRLLGETELKLQPHALAQARLCRRGARHPPSRQIEHRTEEMKPSTYHRNNVNDDRKPCPLLWYYMSIRWDGRVVPCCRDYDNHEILGDITKESLMDIWNGKRFQALRKEHLAGKYENSVLCGRCVEWSKYRMPQPHEMLQRISPVMRII